MGRKVDFGCGNSPRKGFERLNYPETDETDITHNLLQFPYPFNNSELEHAFFDNVLEHFNKEQISEIMEELTRVVEDGGTVEVKVPHYLNKNAYTGNHKSSFSQVFFNCYSVNHRYPVKDIPQNFEIAKVEHVWRDQKLVKMLRKVLPRSWIHTFIPNTVDELRFVLKVRKTE